MSDALWQEVLDLRRQLEELKTREKAIGTGSVTSVGLTMPTAVFDVAGSPVTGSGTLAVTFDNQSANTVLSGPSSGAATTPAFRALVGDDIPITATLVPYGNGSGKLTTEAALAYIEGSDELRAGLLRLPEGATPTTPASGFSLLFAGSSGVNNGVASSVDDAGTVYQMVRYASGTFTPTYFGQTTAGTTTYVAQTGAYTRVGNAVFYTLYVSWSNATGTGNALVGNLPFTAINVAAQVYATAIWYYGITYAAGNGVHTVIQPNTDRVQIWNSPASNTAAVQLAVEAAGELLLTGLYFI